MTLMTSTLFSASSCAQCDSGNCSWSDISMTLPSESNLTPLEFDPAGNAILLNSSAGDEVFS